MRPPHDTYVMSIDATASATADTRPLTEQVAEEIRVAMVRRRVTGAKLARELGVSAAWVSYRLTGTQPIDLNDLQRIAAVLGVTPASLIPNGGLPGRSPSEPTVNPLQPHIVATAGQPRRRRGRPPVPQQRAVRTTRSHAAANSRPKTPVPA